MKFCVYSGTFNPVHIAHLIIAQTVKEEIGAEKVMLIPAYDPPHRENCIAPAKHRMKMLQLATAGNTDFEINDIEFRREGKSYSYLTICDLLKEHENCEKINFIIGTDALAHIDSWFKAEKLVQLVKFIIIPREDEFNFDDFFAKIKLKNIDYTIAKVPFMDISSSYIRSRIQSGNSIKYLVTPNVEDYIAEHGLFGDADD